MTMIMMICIYIYMFDWWWLEHGFYDFPFIGNNHPNWRTHIFQRGRYTTNKIIETSKYIYIYTVLYHNNDSDII